VKHRICTRVYSIKIHLSPRPAVLTGLSSASKRNAPLAAARLFFAYFLYGEAKESEAVSVATGLQNSLIQQLHPMLHGCLRAALQMGDAADVGGDDHFGV
jgi:hypothetical protein